MSVLDEVVTKVKAVVGDKVPASGLVNFLMEYLHKPEMGGVPGLVKKFEAAGLGATIQSWIGGGKPLPITPDDVTKVFGAADIAELAKKADIPVPAATKELAELLPPTVSHLTPGGNIPPFEQFTKVAGNVADKVKEAFLK